MIRYMDTHYTIKQLTERWQCSESFVRKLLGRGKLAYIKINTAVRLPLAEIEKFERERTRKSA